MGKRIIEKRKKQPSRSRSRSLSAEVKDSDNTHKSKGIEILNKEEGDKRKKNANDDNRDLRRENQIKNEQNSHLDEEQQLLNIMGITSFHTTKNKSHVESDLSGVFKGSNVRRKYRQYMNRRGGFNRSLDKMD